MAEIKKKRGGARPGAGGPEADIPLDKLEKLAAMQPTDEEIAGFFNVHIRTVHRHKENPEFLAAMERGKASGRISLRRKQMIVAQSGNPTMLIWLGKTILGQRETVEIVQQQPSAVNYGWVSPKKLEAAEAQPLTIDAEVIPAEKVQ